MRYLLDADILSEPAKPRPSRKVMERLEARRAEVATASPVWHELRTPPFVDGQIASVARVRGLTLVTRNVMGYDDFDGLVVEDWTA